jgi:PIN domain nuclease of toxin-antitoxin system
MGNTFILDACAVLKVINEENGADKVIALYEQAVNQMIALMRP